MIKNVVVISDMHVGSTVSVWPPSNLVEDGSMLVANKFQKWLYERWRRMVADIKEITPRPSLVVLGDTIQGVSERQGQLCTTKVSIQAHVAIELLRPIRECVSELFMIRGTPYHDGHCAEGIDHIADVLEAVPNPDTGELSRWEAFLDLGGYICHFAHHTGGTSRLAYGATKPLGDLLEMRLALMKIATKAPDVRCIVRAHRHTYVQASLGYGLVAVTCPCWHLKDEFAYRKVTSSLPDIGWLHLQWDGKDLHIHEHLYSLPAPLVEKATND